MRKTLTRVMVSAISVALGALPAGVMDTAKLAGPPSLVERGGFYSRGGVPSPRAYHMIGR